VRKPSAIPKTLSQAFRAGFSLAGAVDNLRFQSWKVIVENLEIVRNRAEMRFAQPRAPRTRFAV